MPAPVHATAPSAEPSAAVWRRCYSTHGTRLELSGDDARLCSYVHAVLEHFGMSEVPGAPQPPAIRFHLTAWKRTALQPQGAREIARQDGIRAWTAEGALWLTARHHCIRLDPTSGSAEGRLPVAPAALRKDVIIYAVLLLLRRRGFYGLHASGVSAAGVGCLLVAASGSGKSTTTYALVRQGWHYLGDDALLLRPQGEEVAALALRRDLCLDPALERCFPEVARYGETGPFAGRGKRRLAMRALYPERLLDRCVPRLLVFPEIGPQAESRLVPLRPAEVLPRLVAQSAVLALDPEMIPRHMDTLARLARQARAYRLLAGRDLGANPERVASLLAQVLPSLPPHL